MNSGSTRARDPIFFSYFFYLNLYPATVLLKDKTRLAYGGYGGCGYLGVMEEIKVRRKTSERTGGIKLGNEAGAYGIKCLV